MKRIMEGQGAGFIRCALCSKQTDQLNNHLVRTHLIQVASFFAFLPV